MKYKVIFDRFLKKEGVYDLFYKYYNDNPGKKYRRYIDLPTSYWKDENVDYFISRAFCWAESPIPGIGSWCNLTYKWRDIVRSQDKKYFQCALNEKIKVL